MRETERDTCRYRDIRFRAGGGNVHRTFCSTNLAVLSQFVPATSMDSFLPLSLGFSHVTPQYTLNAVYHRHLRDKSNTFNGSFMASFRRACHERKTPADDHHASKKKKKKRIITHCLFSTHSTVIVNPDNGLFDRGTPTSLPSISALTFVDQSKESPHGHSTDCVVQPGVLRGVAR